MEWILIFSLYAGTFSKGDSVALVAVPGFKTQQECQAAGNAGKGLETVMKASNFVCVARSKSI